ncbi:MAG: hypothetical protein ACSHXA_13725 [Polaribacter sp.]|jgi:hypothetical protein|uniref:hypothetical protein n=1 Tax=Polaribacter sp. TaxID=1920175 RepID=UPI003EF8B802
MKAIFKILIVFTTLFLGNITFAQTFKAKDDTSLKISSFNTQTSQENFLLNQRNVGSENLTTDSNSVYVLQVGDNNNLRSNVKTLESNIVIVQKGDQNNAFLELNSVKLTETVVQIGNNNTFLDYNLLKSDVRNTEINQTGDNQNLTMHGSNSLSEKMKVSMQGQNQSIIIRNF